MNLIVKRTSETREMAAAVVDWLNGKPIIDRCCTEDSRNRVIKIIETITKLDAAVRDAKSKPTLGDFLGGRESSDADVSRFKQDLNQQMRLYRGVPTVALLAKRWFFREGAIHDRTDPDEHFIARTIIELKNCGELHSVRVCECGTWYFARRRDQTFCSTKCRRHNYETSDAHRAKRREYSRNRYHDEKARDERNRARNRKVK